MKENASAARSATAGIPPSDMSRTENPAVGTAGVEPAPPALSSSGGQTAAECARIKSRPRLTAKTAKTLD